MHTKSPFLFSAQEFNQCLDCSRTSPHQNENDFILQWLANLTLANNDVELIKS
jgi:hypothetical protein